MQPGNMQTDMCCNSRRRRRDAVKSILTSLSSIRDAEQRYLDNVPENFRCSESFEIDEYAVETLDEVIGLLADVY